MIYVHLKKNIEKKRTFDQKNGLLEQKTDHFCALKSEMVRLRTKVRKKRTSWQHCMSKIWPQNSACVWNVLKNVS